MINETYDKLARETARRPILWLEQGDNLYYPHLFNMIQTSDSMVGNLTSRAVTFEIYADLFGTFLFREPFKVYQKFASIDEEFPEKENECYLGEYVIDMEESEVDSNSKIFKMTGMVDMEQFRQPIHYAYAEEKTPEDVIRALFKELQLSPEIPLIEGVTDREMFVFNLNTEEGTPYGQIIEAYAQLTFTNAYYDGNDVIFKSILDKENLYEMDYNDVVGELSEIDTYVVNTLKYDNIDGVDDPLINTIEDQEVKDYFYFTDNLFLASYERDNMDLTLQSLVKHIALKTDNRGIEYSTVDISDVYINPSRTLNDFVQIKTRDDKVISTYLTEYMWSYTPAMKGSIVCSKLEDSDDHYLNMTDGKREMLEMGIKVNRVDKELSFYVKQNNSTIDEIWTEMTLTSDGLQIEIQERKEGEENLFQEIGSKISQAKDEVMIEFTRVEGDIGNLEEELDIQRSYYQITPEGAVVGKSDSPLQVTVTNEQISFLDSGSATAWINGKMMYIESVEILNSIVIGYHQFIKYDGAQRSTLLKPVGSGEL